MAHRLSKEELDEQFEQFLKESLSDDSFDSNKKSAVLENLGKPKVKRMKKKDPSPWWTAEDDSDDGDLAVTSRSFLKSQSTSQPIEEVEEEDQVEEMQQSIDPLITSIEKDSLEIDESVLASGPYQTYHGVGLDTLEEQEEKERFFARLEKGASSTIDYSKLNKELDSTDSTQLTALIRADNAKSEDDENKDLSVNYSEDFEDEPEASRPIIKKATAQNEDMADNPELKNQKEETPGMLAKVLLDSLDSTIDTQKLLQQTGDESVTPQGTNEATGTGISNPYTNSDMEALHQAYQILGQSMENTDEQNNYLRTADHTSTSIGDTADSKAPSLKNILTGDSDMSTVDELMQPIRVEEGFSMKPLSVNMQTNNGLLPYSEHKSMEKNPKDLLQKNKIIDYFHHETGGKSESVNVISSPELNLHYQSKTRMIAQDHQSQQQRVASKEPKPSGLFAVHHGVSKHGNDLDLSASTSSGLLHNKLSNKTDRSPTSLLRKSQNTQYAYVKSSGYGKARAQMKQSSIADISTLKETLIETKGKSPADKKHKGILSATRTIRFAEDSASFPKDSGNSDTIWQQQETAAKINLEKSMDNEKINVPIISYGVFDDSVISGSNLSVLQRLQKVEQKLNAAHMYTAAPKENSFSKEKQSKQEMEEMKIKYEDEIKELKQANFILQTQLNADKETIKKKSHLFGDQSSPVTEEKILLIRQEIEEQETLLRGYQQENERLYQQVKVLQFENKQNEEQMFKENQALKTDLIFLREKMKVNSNMPHNQHASQVSEPSTQSFTELIAELRAVQKKETGLLEDIARYKHDKQALEVDLVQMMKERDLLKVQVSNTADDKSYEMNILEDSYKQEINRLNKKLQWFAENQDILDRDAGRLRDAYEQIENLKTQVEKLSYDAGNQSVQQQKRLKDRAADAKRIQDLERQVKEMEAIIKRRYPNSIPALIFAATAVAETDNSTKSNTVAFLERRIKKLETDLESKDEEAKRSLRSMEQQFQKIKIQYESRINELEELHAQRHLNEPQKHVDGTIKIKALEQELSIFKDAHHSTVMNLHKEIETLRQKNLFLEHKSKIKEQNITSKTKEGEMPDQARLTRLNQELITKNKEIQELSKTVERLQKERMIMLSVKPHSSRVSNRNKNLSVPDAGVTPPSKGSTVQTEVFPSMLNEKLYQPDTFADFHISDLIQENNRLEDEVHKLSENLNQQKANYETALSKAECAIKRLKGETVEQVAALKQSHQREIEKLICQNALEHSSSRVAELSSKISTQEIHIKHLQKQLSELQKDRESLAVLRIREETLQREMVKMLDELKMAKECHSPKMKHFLALESKIKHMEVKHSQREQELQQVIQHSRHTEEASQVSELDKWKKLAQQKNVELERFKTELDAILDVLRVLQRQGVVIPTSASQGSEVHWKT
ncbi:centrosomal protein of 162 kDa isoform X2 [Pseudophryne corroboree]|uniref:centrosomal protein of 162 kDa isoform X2 n=1 Tax=Pseudophryne corroboree TaxID=495146 RepID=UPI003081C3A2